jgi:hypothetical protein
MTLEVLRPRALERGEPLVQRLETDCLVGRDLAMHDDEEVNVAVLIGIPDGERALEVRAAEILTDYVARARHQLSEDRVQVGVVGRGVHARFDLD